MDVNTACSGVLFYEQLFASLKHEIEVIAAFMTKQEEEGQTIQDPACLNDANKADLEEVMKSAQSIVEKVEQLDEANASGGNRMGCKEESPPEQTFRNMRTSYITEVEEVLKVVHSLAGLERQSVDSGDSSTDRSDTWRDTDSMINMRKRLEGLLMVDSLAGEEVKRVDTAAEVLVIQAQSVPNRFSVYEQTYASLKNEMEEIAQFLMKLEGAKEECKTIDDARTSKTLRDMMEKDVKEVTKTAESIIEKFEQLDKENASIKHCEEDSPTDQTFTNLRTSYITQVEEVLNVVHSLARVETTNLDEDIWTDSSDTDSMISIRKRLEGLRMVDSLAGAEIQRVPTAEVFIIQLQGPKSFSYDELLIATRGFSEKLGDGGFGSVYRGALPPRIPVAVKRMNADSTNGQGMEEFKGEVLIISQLSHRNLIELRGWCEDQAKKEYMLVYELMPNGSLDKLLFNPVKGTDQVERGALGRIEGREAERATGGGESRLVKGTTCLSWPQRFNILTGVADALDYLHRGWKRQVIHGDIKCANILLDKEWSPKLADFGLSCLVDHQGAAYFTHFFGTRGYAAPELYVEGKFTEKSDVFAFGVVLLEIVCGRRNWAGHAEEQSLLTWVRERLNKGDMLNTVDKGLRVSDRDQMETVLMIGLACCDIDPKKRPSMRLVVKMLDGERDAELRKMVMVEEKVLKAIKDGEQKSDTWTEERRTGLDDFHSVLPGITRNSKPRVIAKLRHGDLSHSSKIVSSLEFDRDDEYFAAAGCSMRIEVFKFETVVNELADVHCPVVGMTARAKLSCLSWNKYLKSHIASSDYGGIVTVWDVNTHQSIMEYKEHEKRAWSVDFSKTEPTRLVSGGDDAKVKVWCTRQETSVMNIDMRANICSVKYNPGSSNFIAVGSADHHIYYYDLRHTPQPLYVFNGHRKSVSYVKFISQNELASASTDSTIRHWDLQENCAIRILRGHFNVHNFVGLTVNSEYIACGSETNDIFLYPKASSQPVTFHQFGSSDHEDRDNHSSHFISALCFKSESPTILAANSQGTIKVLVWRHESKHPS